MDRKDFLLHTWKWLFKPLFLLAAYGFVFLAALFAVLNEDGPERLGVVILLSLGLLYVIAFHTGTILHKVKGRIYARLSDTAKFNLKVAGKVLDFLMVLILGALLYDYWSKDVLFGSVLVVALLMERIYAIVKAERARTTLPIDDKI